MDSLPQFDQFKVHCDPHTAGLRWEKWIIRFERLMEAINVVSQTADSADQKTATDKRRLALLLHYAGSEVEDVFDTLPAKELKLVKVSNSVSSSNDYYIRKTKVWTTVFGTWKNEELPGVDKELTNLENEDIIEPVTDGPTEWISPCHAVPKPKQPGKLRVCVDMRAPNKAILRKDTSFQL
ncbi:hypothetical protein DAPPUDRAFT_120453 [Daphnia pulex]|uniref:Uncharacterized protein n=1 Tax=Daphnia pulex TaxID=6669 RepID=E9I1E4_DAPPU|nr:hypothetical protein DAPPUDRAFT_120453 [Daphnia pulex]|eukprot:EFX62186.1 hypothetical protein DAPPUDRAFT_120453 [Daphnia pulex]